MQIFSARLFPSQQKVVSNIEHDGKVESLKEFRKKTIGAIPVGIISRT